MATLEDIEVYESLSFASVVSYDLDALETFQSIQDDYSTGLRYSNDEKGIEDALKGYIRNLKDRIEKALEQ
mgnify:CR=1 FL=1